MSVTLGELLQFLVDGVGTQNFGGSNAVDLTLLPYNFIS